MVGENGHMRDELVVKSELMCERGIIDEGKCLKKSE